MTAADKARDALRSALDWIGSDLLDEAEEALVAPAEAAVGYWTEHADEVVSLGPDAVAHAVSLVSMGLSGRAYLDYLASTAGPAQRLAARRGSLEDAQKAREAREALARRLIELAKGALEQAGAAAFSVLAQAIAQGISRG